MDKVEITDSDLTKVVSANQTNLTKMILNDNAITDIKCSQNSAIQRLLLYGNPICSNIEKLTILCNSLPDKNNQAYGCIIIGNLDTLNVRNAERQFLLKDWYFGSTLQFDTTALAKIDDKLIQACIPDIWESAEYGDGMTACVMDVALDDTLQNITYDNMIMGWNVADNTSNYQRYESENNSTTNIFHGNDVTNIICGNGTLYYGVCPKSNFYFERVCGLGNTGNSYTLHASDYLSGYNKINEWCETDRIDAVNMSMESQDVASDYFTEAIQTMINTHNTQLICSAGNDGNSIIRYPRANTEPLTIGAASDKTTIANYSNHFEGVNFAAFTGLVTEGNSNFIGTSCSSPFVCGIYILIKKIMWKKYDAEPTCAEVIAEMRKRTLFMNNYDSTYQGAGLLLLNERNHRQDN